MMKKSNFELATRCGGVQIKGGSINFDIAGLDTFADALLKQELDGQEAVLWMFTVDGRYYTAKSKAHALSMLNHPDTHLYPDKPEDFPLTALFTRPPITSERELKLLAEIEGIKKQSANRLIGLCKCGEEREQLEQQLAQRDETILAQQTETSDLKDLNASYFGEVERAFQELEMLGVPRERARHIANGISVFATRMWKDSAALAEHDAEKDKEIADLVCQLASVHRQNAERGLQLANLK
jgi:hypothetical protein